MYNAEDIGVVTCWLVCGRACAATGAGADTQVVPAVACGDSSAAPLVTTVAAAAAGPVGSPVNDAMVRPRVLL